MEISSLSTSSQFSVSTSESSETGAAKGGKPPSHEEAVAQLGSSLSEDQQGEILSGIETMMGEGASDEEIKAYVDSSLEGYGVDVSQAKGTLTDTSV